MTSWTDPLARGWAFVQRDFRETVSYRLAFVLQLYSPFVSVAMFFFVSKMFGAANPSLDRYGGAYFPFISVGLAFLGFMTMGMGIFAASIRQGQMTGTLEAMLVTPTSLTAIVTASSLWAYLRSALNAAIYLAFAALFGLDLSATRPLQALLVLALSVVAFAGLGIISAAFVLAFKRGNPAAALFGSLSSLVGGVFFTVDMLPNWLRPVSAVVPVTYALDGMRQAILGVEGMRPFSDNVLALAVCAAVVLPIALQCFRLAVKHAKREGSLAQY